MTPEELKEEIEILDGINSELQTQVEKLKDELKKKDDTLRMALFLASAMFSIYFIGTESYTFLGYAWRVLLLSIVGTLPPMFVMSGFRKTVFKQWTAVPAIIGSSIACAIIFVLLVTVKYLI